MPSPQPQAQPGPSQPSSSIPASAGGGIGIPAQPGYRQGGTTSMQSNYPGTSVLQGGQRQRVTMEDLTQYYLGKMGTPEEWERKHPRGKFSKLIHEKESPVSTFFFNFRNKNASSLRKKREEK